MRVILLSLFSIIFSSVSYAGNGFDVIALGVWGGIKDGNLSSFLISPHNQNAGVTCDAGSIVIGIDSAVQLGNIENTQEAKTSSLSLSGFALREHIKGYLITHAHLDHVAGLIVASPDDSAKPIYAFSSVLRSLEEYLFNWKIWPNFGNSGVPPLLNKYKLTALAPLKPIELVNTNMIVTALPLSHNGTLSTAFILEYNNDFLVCFGDTGPDEVEDSKNLENVWQYVSAKMKTHHLAGIIIESSYSNDREDEQLFGHLTPKYIHQELAKLVKFNQDPTSLNNLPIIINHIKYALNRSGSITNTIENELNLSNKTGANFIIPKQGEKWHLR